MSPAVSTPGAGPSSNGRSKKQKRSVSAEEQLAPPSKAARVASPTGTGDDFEVDEPQLGNGVDPMAALEAGNDDPMDALDQEAEAEADEARPKRADEFEQQAEREVDASNALGGTAEEGKMKLVHAVRHQVRIELSSTPIKSQLSV